MSRSLLHSLAAAVVVASALLAGARPAAASKPRCRLERIDPAQLEGGKLTLYASALELEGDVIEGLTASQFTLLVNGKPKGKAETVEPFFRRKEPVDVALVVEVAAQFKPALDRVRDALKEFLEDQPSSMKVSLITYGSEISRPTPWMAAAAMSGELDNLSPEDDTTDVAMTGAVQAALNDLKRRAEAKSPTGNEDEKPNFSHRRIILLVSDGLNARMDKATFKTLGEAAAKAGVPIHTVAFSPIDARGPLLNLGDLSKRSNGTFRWAQTSLDAKGKIDWEQTAPNIKQQLDTLANEVRKQYVVTFPTDLSSTEKKTFGLVCRDVTSNALNGNGRFGLESSSSGKGSSWWMWILYVLGGLVGLLGLLWLVGMILKAREAKAMRMGPGMPGAMAAGGQPMRPGHPSAAVQQGWQQPQPRQGSAFAAPQQGYAAPQQGWQPPQGAQPGAAGRAAPQQAYAAPQQAVAGAGTLICVTGAQAGTRISVAQPVTIGSAGGNSHVVQGDASVAPRHCAVQRHPQGFAVSDLGSTSGTYVNGQRLTGPAWIKDGDVLRVGNDTQFKFRIG